MKNKILILVIAMALSAFTGCQSSGTIEKEEAQDNTVSIEEGIVNEQNQDADNEATENNDNDEMKNEDEEANNSETTDNITQDSDEAPNNNSNNNNNNNNNNNSNTVIEENNSNNVNNNVGSDDNLDNNAPSNDNDGQGLTNVELSTIIEKIYEIKDPGLRVGNIEVDLSDNDAVEYYTGLKDASKVKDALVSEAMVGSQAYSLVLVRVNDSADSQSVANEMKNGINPSKWVCVTADDLQVVNHEDLVLLIMVGSTHADTVTSQQIVDAFKGACGA